MDKSISCQVERILKLYHALPREPQKAYSIEKLKQKVRKFYNNEIDEKSINKNILRDLRTIELLLVSGEVIETKASGRQASSFCLSQNACIEQFGSELALVLVMAREYLSQSLPNTVYEKVKGFFEAAEQQLEKDTQIGAWHSKIRFVPEGYGKINKEEQHTLAMQKIYEALINDNLWLEALYRKENSHTQTKYILKPQGIIQHGQQPYLIASKIVGSKSELRTFNLLRFDEINLIGEKTYVDINHYDIDVLVDEREFENAYFDRVVQDIFFVFHEELLEELELKPIGNDQNIQRIQDHEYYELRATCCITTSLMNWLIEKSHLIQMITPKELREEIVYRATVALERNDHGDSIITLESLLND
ncbi:WYL domain-containing protein [Acinetobacter gyllenbergii]|uniref:WYL domain-containing protein n=1 Tax=Acinetobacter gyllenbergii TaxID=134534 RepID=UPI0021CDEE5E|nr:WYL domain-containing protein [Acinetobacter gyllenbergii]MCU4582994.1 WYL domain-containing protein [Acinetobacter gyllenbergii]